MRERTIISVAETYDFIVTIPENGKLEFRATVQDGSGFTSAFLGKGMAAIRYAPISTVVQAHELEIFGRYLLADAGEGSPVGIAVNGSYNIAANSFDGECLMNWHSGIFILSGTVRAFSSAYQKSDSRASSGGGLVVELTSSIALAADILSLQI